MLSQYLALGALTLSSVVALPSSIQKRQDEATFDGNGNLHVTFSRRTVNIGNIPLDDIFNEILGACPSSGNCEELDFKFNGQTQETGINAPGSEPIELTMRPDGNYVEWIRNGLWEALKAAVTEVAKCEVRTNTATCIGGIHNPGCAPGNQVVKMTVCEVPAYFAVNFQHPDETNSAPPKMGASLVSNEIDSDLCEDLVGAVGGLAGAVHGVAGGIFSLANLLCKA